MILHRTSNGHTQYLARATGPRTSPVFVWTDCPADALEVEYRLACDYLAIITNRLSRSPKDNRRQEPAGCYGVTP